MADVTAHTIDRRIREITQAALLEAADAAGVDVAATLADHRIYDRRVRSVYMALTDVLRECAGVSRIRLVSVLGREIRPSGDLRASPEYRAAMPVAKARLAGIEFKRFPNARRTNANVKPPSEEQMAAMMATAARIYGVGLGALWDTVNHRSKAVSRARWSVWAALLGWGLPATHVAAMTGVAPMTVAHWRQGGHDQQIPAAILRAVRQALETGEVQEVRVLKPKRVAVSALPPMTRRQKVLAEHREAQERRAWLHGAEAEFARGHFIRWPGEAVS